RVDSVALAGELLTALLNTSMYTYEVAPVLTLLENATLRHMRSFLGWPRPPAEAGSLCSSTRSSSASLCSSLSATVLAFAGDDGADDHGDGIFAPGGSMCNLYAMLVARHHAFPEAREAGLLGALRTRGGGLPRAYTSAQGHYSMQKAA